MSAGDFSPGDTGGVPAGLGAKDTVFSMLTLSVVGSSMLALVMVVVLLSLSPRLSWKVLAAFSMRISLGFGLTFVLVSFFGRGCGELLGGLEDMMLQADAFASTGQIECQTRDYYTQCFQSLLEAHRDLQGQRGSYRGQKLGRPGLSREARLLSHSQVPTWPSELFEADQRVGQYDRKKLAQDDQVLEATLAYHRLESVDAVKKF